MPGKWSVAAIASSSAMYGEYERWSQRRVNASIAGSSMRAGRQPGHAIVPQRACTRARVEGMANGPAFAHVDDGNANQPVHPEMLTIVLRAEPYPARRMGAAPRRPAAPAVAHWP